MSGNNEDGGGPNGGRGGGSGLPSKNSESCSNLSTGSGQSGGSSTTLLGNCHYEFGSRGSTIDEQQSDIVKEGLLRKFKGNKRYFVLRRETEEGGPARLEYYVKQRYFRLGQAPKRSIILRNCFNINRTDAKCKYAIALHTHNDCLRIQFSTEDELNEWLRLMNSLCGDEEEIQEMYNSQSGGLKPHYEHVWLVTVINKGLGSTQGFQLHGNYRLCLTSKELSLVKVGAHEDKQNSVVTFPLMVIRNVSHDAVLGCFFHIELGRLACTGAGKLSLKTEDNNIAQNMHLFILKAMQNSSKEDTTQFSQISQLPQLPLIPQPGGRNRTNTWNDSNHTRSGSVHSTPPKIPRIPSVDSSIRTRAESMSERRVPGISPPVAIYTPTSNSYNTGMCSTDSASSSYSVEFENNILKNGNGGGGSSVHSYSKSQEDYVSYVPFNPADHSQPDVHSLTLPLHDHSDYVDTTLGNGTPLSNLELQSPVSPFDNYLAMSPAGVMLGGNGGVKSSGKLSVSHSRNSSLIEDNDAYLSMQLPAHPSHSRSESGACSTTGSTLGLDDGYLDMDFSQKLNLSNDDIRRMSPASSESIQSGTPSSDYQLEKVSSYLQSDDFEDGSIAMRPARAYSVGSRSDTSSTGKSRGGKNRLEAVQETFRTRAMSVGSKQPPRKIANPSSTTSGFSGSSLLLGQSRSGSVAPLSSSWSGSTGRWLQPKIHYTTTGPNIPNTTHSQIQHQPQESGDSDLMELDFSHNKQRSRKRSIPGPNGNLSSSSSTGSGVASKLSPCARAVLGSETPPSVETPDTPRSSSFSANLSGSGSPRYATSAPISIQKNNKNAECGDYIDCSNSILARISGLDLNKLKELDENGAYLAMDFSNPLNVGLNTTNGLKSVVNTKSLDDKTANEPATEAKPTETHSSRNIRSTERKTSDTGVTSKYSTPVVIKAKAVDSSVAPAKFTISSSHHSSSSEPPGLSRSLSSSSNISTTSNNSNSSSTSCVSVKSQQQAPLSPERSVPLSLNLSLATTSVPFSPSLQNTGTTTVNSGPAPATPTGTSSILSRIEESPEKPGSHLPRMPMQPSQPNYTAQHFRKASQEDGQVNYSTIQHVNPIRRNKSFPCEISEKSQLPPTSALIQPSTCGKQSSTTACTSKFSSETSSPAGIGGVTYAQVEFLKNAVGVKLD